jgi:ABC-type Na+ efflux pump permease subunit
LRELLKLGLGLAVEVLHDPAVELEGLRGEVLDPLPLLGPRPESWLTVMVMIMVILMIMMMMMIMMIMLIMEGMRRIEEKRGETLQL